MAKALQPIPQPLQSGLNVSQKWMTSQKGSEISPLRPQPNVPQESKFALTPRELDYLGQPAAGLSVTSKGGGGSIGRGELDARTHTWGGNSHF